MSFLLFVALFAVVGGWLDRSARRQAAGRG